MGLHIHSIDRKAVYLGANGGIFASTSAAIFAGSAPAAG
jgi:hypothetical protein